MRGSEVARNHGDYSRSISRVQEAQRTPTQVAISTRNCAICGLLMDLAESTEAGTGSRGDRRIQEASVRLTQLGRDDTEPPERFLTTGGLP